MGRRGPLPIDPDLRAVRGGRIRPRHWAPAEAVEAWIARAKDYEARAKRLIDQGMKAKLVKSRSNGPQMDPRFAAGLKLHQAADDLWDRLYRLAPAEDSPTRKDSPEPTPPDTLDAFRRKRHDAP